MVCACSMDKSSIKFWLLFDLKCYIAFCSDCTKSTIGGCKKGIDPAVQRHGCLVSACLYRARCLSDFGLMAF